ncbi:LppM family (lipo)protein [Pseudolysinimonas sp.]|uniref:LppM family (lipo)protein n=1 Tax=Pseudolysinimonas sp. TaxID=2680009 RepID=UPI00286C97E3|nr:hypothetical protein [Pseudolysinimonas sp.]
MRRRILPRILAVGVLVLALAGCVRFQADLTLNPENTVDGSIVVAVLVSEDTEEAREQSLSAAEQIEADLLGSLRDASGVTTSEYEQDEYLGSRIVFDDVALDAFSGQSEDSLKIVREDDEYVFTGALDFSGESVPPEDTGEGDDDNLTVSVTFPGEVTEHNGELSGTTVTWATAVDQRLEMSARGSATPAGPPILLIVGIGLVALLVIAAVVAVLLFVRSRAKKKAAVAAPETAPTVPIAEAPAAEVPAAPTPAVEAPATTDAPEKKPRAPRAPNTPPTPEV